jgi:hypothetical protein
MLAKGLLCRKNVIFWGKDWVLYKTRRHRLVGDYKRTFYCSMNASNTWNTRRSKCRKIEKRHKKDCSPLWIKLRNQTKSSLKIVRISVTITISDMWVKSKSYVKQSVSNRPSTKRRSENWRKRPRTCAIRANNCRRSCRLKRSNVQERKATNSKLRVSKGRRKTWCWTTATSVQRICRNGKERILS